MLWNLQPVFSEGVIYWQKQKINIYLQTVVAPDRQNIEHMKEREKRKRESLLWNRYTKQHEHMCTYTIKFFAGTATTVQYK